MLDSMTPRARASCYLAWRPRPGHHATCRYHGALAAGVMQKRAISWNIFRLGSFYVEVSKKGEFSPFSPISRLLQDVALARLAWCYWAGLVLQLWHDFFLLYGFFAVLPVFPLVFFVCSGTIFTCSVFYCLFVFLLCFSVIFFYLSIFISFFLLFTIFVFGFFFLLIVCLIFQWTLIFWHIRKTIIHV